MTVVAVSPEWLRGLVEKLDAWALVGAVGQIVFGSRFVVQWLRSEKEKRVVIPVEFWWISITGGLITLVYAASRQDPVFMAAQIGGLVMYARNLALHRRNAGGAAT